MTESLTDRFKKLESSLTQIINLFERGDIEKLKNIDTAFEREISPALKDLFVQYPSETDWVFRHGKDPAALSWLERCIRGEEKPYYRMMGDKVARIDPYVAARILNIQNLVKKLDEERAKVCQRIGKYEKFKETYQGLIDLAANLLEVYENVKSISEIGYKFLKNIGILNYEEQKQEKTQKQKEPGKIYLLHILLPLFLLSFLAFFHLVDFSTQGMFLAQPTVSAAYLIIASMLLVILLYFLFKKK